MKTFHLILVGALFFLQSIDSHAAGIYQRDYEYSFEGMAREGAHERAFVICEDACTSVSYLAAAPRFPVLSVKVSRDEIAGEGVQKVPERGGEGTTTNEDEGDRQRSPAAQITVLFDLDSSVLTDVEKARLSSFAAGLTDEMKDAKISVTGYTCDLGSKAHNAKLARRRAEVVAAYLRKAGSHPSRVEGMGKCCYVAGEPDKRYLNRRVEVRTDRTEVTR